MVKNALGTTVTRGGVGLIGSGSVQVTRLLKKWTDGDPEALDQLLSLVYNDLKRIARKRMVGERPDHTFSATDLVHEAFLRLDREKKVRFNDRAHFLALCARKMRQILIDHARQRNSDRRGKNCFRVPIDGIDIPDRGEGFEFVVVNEIVTRVGDFNARHGAVLEMRLFGGLTIKEMAAELGVAEITIKRDLEFVSKRVRKELGKTDEHRSRARTASRN